MNNERNYTIYKNLTKKEFEKIDRNVKARKSAKIYRYCLDKGFIGSIEVREGQLSAVLYSKYRYGSTNEPVRELLSFPVTIDSNTDYSEVIRYSSNEFWNGRNPEIHGYCSYDEDEKFNITAIIKYDEKEANTYKDILGNILNVGDKVVYSNSSFAILNVGKIEKLNDCTARIDGYNVSYDQIAKVTK